MTGYFSHISRPTVILSSGSRLTRSLQVRPLLKGSRGPMKVVVQYRDRRNQDLHFDHTFDVPDFSEGDSTNDFRITGVPQGAGRILPASQQYQQVN